VTQFTSRESNTIDTSNIAIGIEFKVSVTCCWIWKLIGFAATITGASEIYRIKSTISKVKGAAVDGTHSVAAFCTIYTNPRTDSFRI